MEIKRYSVDGFNFEFVCKTWETRNAWGHKVVLFCNDVSISEYKCRYYNRTWEKFQYQSCMLGAISDRKRELVESGIARYKKANNITHFKKGERVKAMEDITHCHSYAMLVKLYETIVLGNERGSI